MLIMILNSHQPECVRLQRSNLMGHDDRKMCCHAHGGHRVVSEPRETVTYVLWGQPEVIILLPHLKQYDKNKGEGGNKVL